MNTKDMNETHKFEERHVITARKMIDAYQKNNASKAFKIFYKLNEKDQLIVDTYLCNFYDYLKGNREWIFPLF